MRVGTNHNMPNALIHHRPTNELQAKFRMEFCMAILLLEGRAGLGEFTDEVVLRPDVKAMIEKIDFGVDPEAEAAGYHKMTTIIDIELNDGRTISGRADFGKGSPANPMSYDEVADKFRRERRLCEVPRRAGRIGGGHGARLRNAAFDGPADGGADARRLKRDGNRRLAACRRSDLDLRAQLHHRVVRQVQEVRRRAGVVVHLREQLFAPRRHAAADASGSTVSRERK